VTNCVAFQTLAMVPMPIVVLANDCPLTGVVSEELLAEPRGPPRCPGQRRSTGTQARRWRPLEANATGVAQRPSDWYRARYLVPLSSMLAKMRRAVARQ